MTKLTPYGKALAWIGLILILCTIALVVLYNRSKPHPLEDDLVVDYQNKLDQMEQTVEEYRQGEWQAKLRAARLNDSLDAIRQRMAAQTERINNLKNQANAASNYDYRRHTDLELERILSTRYQNSPGH
jgi:hypothetical protein